MAGKTSANVVDKKVSGEPTKDFFITMLIKDITLRDAIGDLVDNSVDAIKTKAEDPNYLTGFWIHIEANDKSFTIVDNGSGIEEKIARDYAFKLGKPSDHDVLEKSIGRFGIGMKRAFFKLGSEIIVRSIAPTSRFELSLPVSKWKDKPSWDFEFTEVFKGEKNSSAQTGTTIIIKSLSADAKENFKKTIFENELIDEISREQILNIHKGISIKINGHELNPRPLTIKYNNQLTPSFWSQTFKHINPETKEVKELRVDIYAGVSTEDEDEGGWNIFCNDRLIVDRDKTELTGWTGAGGDGVAKYHQQFYGFRGYVFFEAKDSKLLPWNTTKTGIDPDSADFIVVRAKMIDLMKDVNLLLNQQKKEREKDNPQKNQLLNNFVASVPTVPILDIIQNKIQFDTKFNYPKLMNPVKVKDSQQIKFSVPTVKFVKVKSKIKGTSPADVGSLLFDYYYENEIDE